MSARSFSRETAPVTGVLAAPHEGVRYTINGSALHIHFSYRGTPDELVRCGVVTVAQLAHRSRNQYDELLDGDREPIRIYNRRTRRIEVHRYKRVNLDSMPAFEPWMGEALETSMREASAVVFGCEEHALTRDEWRGRMISRTRSALAFVVAGTARDSGECVWIPLPIGVEVASADLEAFKARAAATADELEGMLSRMRIIRPALERRGLRLVVDNTRRAGQSRAQSQPAL